MNEKSLATVDSVLYARRRKQLAFKSPDETWSCKVLDLKTLSKFLAGQSRGAGRGVQSFINLARQRLTWQLFPCSHYDLIACGECSTMMIRLVDETYVDICIWYRARTSKALKSSSYYHLRNFVRERIPGLAPIWQRTVLTMEVAIEHA